MKKKYEAMLEKNKRYDTFSDIYHQLLLKCGRLEAENKQLQPKVSKLENVNKKPEERLKVQKRQIKNLTDNCQEFRSKFECQKMMSDALAMQYSILLTELYDHYKYDEKKDNKPPKLLAIEAELKKYSFDKFLRGKASKENIYKEIMSRSADVKLPNQKEIKI